MKWMVELTRAEALALLGGGVALATPAVGAAQAAAPIRIAASLTEPYMLPYYAVDIGTFGRAGLNVTLTTQPTVASVVEAVASNNADVGQGDVIQLANAITRGNLPLAIFAGGGIYSAAYARSLGLAVARQSPYHSARDLEEQTVGVITLNSLMAIGVETWLRQNGADLSKVKLIELLFPQMAPAIGKGLIAAAFMGEPFLSFSDVDLRVLCSAVRRDRQGVLFRLLVRQQGLAGGEPRVGAAVRCSALRRGALVQRASERDHGDAGQPCEARYQLAAENRPDYVCDLARPGIDEPGARAGLLL